MVEISTDRARLDIDVIWNFIRGSYWAEAIPREIMERAIDGSLCFGAFEDAAQVGFARVVTDKATFAYLADVFVLESHRGRGISKQLMQAVMDHPDLQRLRRWSLVTKDAHGLYEQFGFVRPARPERYMEITRPGIYLEAQS
jgi:GNAT superfamily N-acetyltransferase